MTTGSALVCVCCNYCIQDIDRVEHDDCMAIKESLRLMNNIFNAANQSLVAIAEESFKPVFKQISDVKSHLSDENEEVVVKKFSQLQGMMQWSVPIMYSNFMHPFVAMFNAGSVFFQENDAMESILEAAQEACWC